VGNAVGTSTIPPSESVEVEEELLGTSAISVVEAPSVCTEPPAVVFAGTGTAVGSPGACGPGGVTGGPRRSVLHLGPVSTLNPRSIE
jgi:hypothetical protein